MPGQAVIPFVTPDSLKYEIVLPNAGKITGLDIQRGATLIT
jgi:predicted ABC-class ATPase